MELEKVQPLLQIMPDTLKPATILITGASGFLGGEIARLCVGANRSIRCLGRRADDRWIDYHQVDLASDAISPEIFCGVKTVIHCAGLAHQFGSSGDSVQPFFDANCEAVRRLAIASANNGVDHFVLISSSGVYGPAQQVRDETSLCNPVGPYAESKLAGEHVAIEVAKSTQMRLSIARMTTLYGSGDRGNMNRLIKAISSKRFVRIGNGENRKNFFHKTDAATACLTLADSAKCDQNIEIYNLGDDAVTVKQLTEAIVVATGATQPIKLPAGMVTACSGVASLICLNKGPFSRIHKSIRKLLSNDEFSVEKFQQAFSFKANINLSQGIQEQVSAMEPANVSAPAAGSRILKRLFDFSASFFALCILLIPMAIISALVKLTSKGPVLYVSQRVGKDNRLFNMAKFRTMRTDAPEVATHLLGDSQSWITPLGKVLRKTSLDELPQLFNILKGEMSLVGPRPALHNQDDLNKLRTLLGVHHLTPGITGLAQVSGRDELLICEKVEFDRQYLHRQSLPLDIKLIFQTALAVVAKKGVKQADEDNGSQVDYTVLRTGQPSGMCLLAAPDSLTPVAKVVAEMAADIRVVCVRDEARITPEFIDRVSNQANRIIAVRRNQQKQEHQRKGLSVLWASLGAKIPKLEKLQLACAKTDSDTCIKTDEHAVRLKINRHYE